MVDIFYFGRLCNRNLNEGVEALYELGAGSKSFENLAQFALSCNVSNFALVKYSQQMPYSVDRQAKHQRLILDPAVC